MRHRHRLLRVVALVALATFLGCASTPYRYATGTETKLTLKLRPDEPQIERGRPNAFVDGVGHYFFSLPSKLLFLSWSLDNHDISLETEETLARYLRANGLCDVKVRLNQYAPGGEWQRLFRNKEMPAFWRYTLGILSVAFYTIFPDRAFAGFPLIPAGGDSYNPFTNTVSIYSDLQAVVLHEGGHAKDFGLKTNRHWKGGYAALRILPLVPLWQELVATDDALSWSVAREDSAVEKSAYRKLYPAYGSYVGGESGDVVVLFTPWFWIYYAVYFGAIVLGHIIGQIRALFVGDRAAPDPVWYSGEFQPPDECPIREIDAGTVDEIEWDEGAVKGSAPAETGAPAEGTSAPAPAQDAEPPEQGGAPEAAPDGSAGPPGDGDAPAPAPAPEAAVPL